MNLAAVEDMEARFPDTDVVLIESGGDNLTLTFSPALVDFFIYVIDVAAGDKIPRKNGPGISQSDILVINKTDLAPYVGASLEVMERDSRLMRGDKPFVFTNCKTGEGIDELVALIRENVAVRPRAEVPPHDRPGRRRAGTGAVPGRARAAAQRVRRQGRRAAARVRAPRRPRRSWSTCYRRAPLLVQQALYWDEGMPGLPCVFIITTSGGVLQGDRYEIGLDVGAGSPATSRPRPRRRSTRWTRTTPRRPRTIVLGEGAYLEYLPGAGHPVSGTPVPHPTPGSRSPDSATLLYAEILHAGPQVLRGRRALRLRPVLLDGARRAARRSASCSPRSS